MTKATRKNESPLRTVEEVARQLAISKKSVRRLIASGTLRSYRIGRVIRICDEDLRRYLAERRR